MKYLYSLHMYILFCIIPLVLKCLPCIYDSGYRETRYCIFWRRFTTEILLVPQRYVTDRPSHCHGNLTRGKWCTFHYICMRTTLQVLVCDTHVIIHHIRYTILVLTFLHFINTWYYIPTHRVESGGYIAITLSVRPFTLSLKMSQLLLEEIILFLIHDFGVVTCTMSPLSRLTVHLLPVYRAT